MATPFYGDNVFDKGLEYILNNVDEQRVLSSYTPGDSYATVVSNTVCTINMAPSDMSLGDQGTGREIIINPKSGTASASSGAAPDLAIALTYSVGTEVIVVTDETTNQEITINNPINVPQWRAKMNQPTVV